MTSTETALTVLGVPGRRMPRHTRPHAPHLWSTQKWISEPRPVTGFGAGGRMNVTIEFDDNCKNGHNTFHISGEISSTASRRRQDCESFGLMPEEIAKYFPELTPLLKWSGCHQDSPLHYVANTVYLAGDRDHQRKRAGEVTSTEVVLTFADNPIEHRFGGYIHSKFVKYLQEYGPASKFDFTVIQYDHNDRETFKPRFTFGGFAEWWHECPFDTKQEALNFLHALQHCQPQFKAVATAWSDGKARELDSARRSAIWPDATDAELMAEPEDLKAALLARLPGLMAEFRAMVESIGLAWEAVMVASC